ncbi:MAG: excalibur calcium-binding domain-containing protein [Actinoplanes sp.]
MAVNRWGLALGIGVLGSVACCIGLAFVLSPEGEIRKGREPIPVITSDPVPESSYYLPPDPALLNPTPSPSASKKKPKPKVTTTPKEPSAYYANCTAARRAGVTPLFRGDPGYRRALDRDEDGKACD